MNQAQWNELTIEQRGEVPPLSDNEFREWMANRPIFVSSVMDAEMTHARTAVRDWITSWGAEAVMWEEITPRDQQAEHAYIDGVDRSGMFVLLLGSRYGVRDETGYSPTHKEAKRAADRAIPRLLFERDGLKPNQRDGELNDWVRSLHNEVSTTKYNDERELIRKLERRMREIASAQETLWIKAGPVIMPGRIEQSTSQGVATFTIRAIVRGSDVRHAINELTHQSSAFHVDRLTWGLESVPVEHVNVETHTKRASEIEVTLSCRPGNRGSSVLAGMTYNEGGRSIGPVEQVRIWADQALFGIPPSPDHSRSLAYTLTVSDGPALPQVLKDQDARGWLADGFTRLYIVEGLITKFGGRFLQLTVGPATATAIRVSFRFCPDSLSGDVAEVTGIVPLR